MKKIVLVIILSFFSLVVSSQRIVTDIDKDGFRNGDYLIDNNIDPYVGTWEWKSDNNSFIIIISKKEKMALELNPDFIVYNDMAIGWHSYTKGGVLVESSLDKQTLPTKNAREALSISTLSGNVKQKSYLSLRVEDLTKKKKADAELTFVQGKTDELHWKVFVKESSYPMKQENFTLPVDIILKKVK